MDRKKYIGGSDIAALMGVSRWKTPLQLWAEKTGEIKEADLSDNEAVQLGSELEDFVAKKFERATEFKVRRAPKRYIHTDLDFISCQVDRLLEGKDELLECKTCSLWKAKEWEGEEIPQEYILQVMWQLGITKRQVGWIAVLIGGQSFKYKRINYDPEMFDRMVEAAEKFWQMVENKQPPMAMGEDNFFIQKLYPESDETMQEANDMEERVAYLQETKMHIDEMMKEKAKVEAEIKQRIGDDLGLMTPNYIVTWRTQVRRSVNVELLKEHHLYEDYTKPTKSRVMRIKKGVGNGQSTGTIKTNTEAAK